MLFYCQEAGGRFNKYDEDLFNETPYEMSKAVETKNLRRFISRRGGQRRRERKKTSPTADINCLKKRLEGIKTTIKALHMSLANTIMLLTTFHKDRHKNLR